MSDALQDLPGAGFADTVLPSEQEAVIARESSRALAPFRDTKRGSLRVRVTDNDGGRETEVEIPAAAFRLLADALAEMSLGHAVTFIPQHAELTTQQAANVLKVSRPYLVGLLEQGAIPHRKVGTHRRVPFAALIDYKNKIDAARRDTIVQLMRDGEELEMGR
jgi:excisionase family DNA binding protein